MGQVSQVAAVLIGAGILGTAVGVASVGFTPPVRQAVIASVNDVAVATGMQRARPPRPGDYWRGCNDARAAGTAPIYRGEPGYRSGMDGDDDGIACEPYR